MPLSADFLMYSAVIGAGATAFMDLWALARKWLLGTPPPDYAMVGRWLAYMPRGRFRHDAIARSAPLPGERAIGWIAHYLIGMSFAGILLFIWGVEWARHPTVAPALIVGIGSVLAPYFLMQPGMGAGIAARRTPHPTAARWRSLRTHAVFAVGLFVSAWTIRLVTG